MKQYSRILLVFSTSLLTLLIWSNALALDAPVLVSPDDDATDISLTLWLNWEDVTGAESYEIRYVNTENSCDAILDGNWIELTTHPSNSPLKLTGLSPEERYCWKVQAEAQSGDSAWSEKRAFTTIVLPDPSSECEDGIDNDADNRIDYPNDPGCDSLEDDNEQDTESPDVCDNDGDCDAGENITNCPLDCTGGGPGGGGTLENPISAENLTDLFNKVFSFLFGLAIFIVPVIVIYAAFLMLMGGGDPVKLAKGRMILLWTAVAFILILLSRGLPVVFKNLL